MNLYHNTQLLQLLEQKLHKACIALFKAALSMNCSKNNLLIGSPSSRNLAFTDASSVGTVIARAFK